MNIANINDTIAAVMSFLSNGCLNENSNSMLSMFLVKSHVNVFPSFDVCVAFEEITFSGRLTMKVEVTLSPFSIASLYYFSSSSCSMVIFPLYVFPFLVKIFCSLISPKFLVVAVVFLLSTRLSILSILVFIL